MAGNQQVVGKCPRPPCLGGLTQRTKGNLKGSQRNTPQNTWDIPSEWYSATALRACSEPQISEAQIKLTTDSVISTMFCQAEESDSAGLINQHPLPHSMAWSDSTVMQAIERSHSKTCMPKHRTSFNSPVILPLESQSNSHASAC